MKQKVRNRLGVVWGVKINTMAVDTVNGAYPE
jgi:hypothetical protein